VIEKNSKNRSEEVIEKLREEAEILKEMNHPNIVKLHNVRISF